MIGLCCYVCKHWQVRTLRQQNFIIYSAIFVVAIFKIQISGDNYYYSKNGPMLVFSLCVCNFYIVGLQCLYKNSEKTNLHDRPINLVSNSIQDVDQDAITSKNMHETEIQNYDNAIEVSADRMYDSEDVEDAKADTDIEFEIGSDKYDEVDIADQGDYESESKSSEEVQGDHENEETPYEQQNKDEKEQEIDDGDFAI